MKNKEVEVLGKALGYVLESIIDEEVYTTENATICRRGFTKAKEKVFKKIDLEMLTEEEKACMVYDYIQAFNKIESILFED